MQAPAATPALQKLLVSTAIYAVIASVAMPLFFEAMLDLTFEQTRWVLVTYLVGSVALLVTMTAGLLVGLRGVSGASADDEIARRRVLRLPVRLAGLVVIVGGAVCVLSALLRVLQGHDRGALIAGVALTTLALLGALAVPMYVGARGLLQDHALFFAKATLPPGRRTPIGALAGYTILSVAAIALVPSAFLGNARLDKARDEAVLQRARATARRVAQVLSTPHSESRALIDHIHLEHASVLERLPDGKVEPASRAQIVTTHAAEAPLFGPLAGGSAIVAPEPEPTSWAPLLLVVVVLEALVALVALSLARALARDAASVKAQVEALADDREPPPVATMTSTEIRRVALALNRLLERIPRLQLEKYLAVEQAEESRRLKSMFLANMSHDLRSPLNSILGFSELLTRGLEGPITPGQRAQLDDIHAAGSHLLRLLSEILETARAESGHLDLDRKPVPPTTFVTQARKEALRGRTEAVADRLEIELQAGMAPAHVDALRMQQALTHALDWAIEVAHGGTVHVDVADRDRPRGRALVIEIWCDGTTSLEEEAQLFQPFRKVEGVPGLHLALPLARRLVEAHGGTMEAYGGQRPGVRILLPRGAGTRQAASAAAAERGRS